MTRRTTRDGYRTARGVRMPAWVARLPRPKSWRTLAHQLFVYDCSATAPAPRLIMPGLTDVDADNLAVLLWTLHELGAGTLTVGVHRRRNVTLPRSWWATVTVRAQAGTGPYRNLGVDGHATLVDAVSALTRATNRATSGNPDST